jgi:hypothetical protein
MDAARIYRARPTQPEIDDVLGQRLAAAVGTLNEDGSIHLVYVIFLYEGGRLVFETASITRKARNVAARDRASFLVHGTASTGRSLMVSADGRAQVLTGEAARSVSHRIRSKYVVDDAIADLNRAWDPMDDVAVVITPERWRSWTGDALAAFTTSATGRDYDGMWRSEEG